MLRVINDLLYDTEKSTLIGYKDERGYGLTSELPVHCIVELYKTKNNNFFRVRKYQNRGTTGLFKIKIEFIDSWDCHIDSLSLGNAIALYNKLKYKNKSYEETFDFEIKEA